LDNNVSDAEIAFLGTIFTAALAFGAILFGVFGIFYSVYAMYASLPNPQRAKICDTLRDLCRFLAFLGLANWATAAVPLWYLTPYNSFDEALAGILIASAFGLTVVSLVLALKYMH
jgi:hypothetical protein